MPPLSNAPAAGHRPSWRPSIVLALLLAACGGGGGGDPQPLPSSRPASTLPSSQPGDLLAYVQARLRARTQPGSGASIGTAGDVAAPTLVAATADGSAGSSGTTVQESGVDEDDLLKTDGAAIYSLVRGDAYALPFTSSRLQVHGRRADGGLEPPVALTLPVADDGVATARGMYLAAGARRVAVLGDLQVPWATEPCPVGLACIQIIAPDPQAWTQPAVLLDLVDVADPARPAHAERVRIDGRLLGSRMIGNSLVLVTQHAPRLAVDRLPAGATAAEREAAIAALSAADLLPTVRVGRAAPQALHAETDCVVQPKNSSTAIELTSITVVDLASPTLARTSRCFAGGAEALYMSSASLYLATTRSDWSTGATMIRYAPQFVTDIHKFRLDAAGATYRGSGEVSGHLGWDGARKSYRMSEHAGDLRVLSFTGEMGWIGVPGLSGPASAQAAPPSPATLTILRERVADASLQVIARLPNDRRPQAIGRPGEQVYGVRFVGDRGYVVTFRQIDPLYVLDLADPADPRAAGELKMTGFSDYLYPMGGGLLLGIGKDADDTGRVGGVKFALFDVADAAQPSLLASLVFGERGSTSALDHSPHGVNFFRPGGVVRVALPLTAAQGATGGYRHGLQRIEVDTAARTLRARPLLAPPATSGYPDLSNERSVQIGAQVYYLSQGRLVGADW